MKKKWPIAASIKMAIPPMLKITMSIDGKEHDKLIGKCKCGDFHGIKRLLDVCIKHNIHMSPELKFALDNAIAENAKRLYEDFERRNKLVSQPIVKVGGK